LARDADSRRRPGQTPPRGRRAPRGAWWARPRPGAGTRTRAA